MTEVGTKKYPLSQEEFNHVVASIFSMWEDHVNGFVDVYEKDGKTRVALDCLEDRYEYDSIGEAVADVLYTIGEWIKEG